MYKNMQDSFRLGFSYFWAILGFLSILYLAEACHENLSGEFLARITYVQNQFI